MGPGLVKFMSNRFYLKNKAISSRVVAGAVFFLAALASWPIQAGVYSWKDEKGAIHFTDKLYDIPKKYREGELGFKKYRSARPPSFFLESEDRAPSSSPPDAAGADAREYVIPLIPTHGGNFMVEVVLNNNLSAKLMVDTGASLVTISEKIAKQLGYRFNSQSPKTSFSTAGGVVWMPMLALKTIAVGGTSENMMEASVNDQMGDLDGLLGMSFLGDYRVEMDKARRQMILKRLGDPGDRRWGGRSALWWKGRFSGYAQKIKGFQNEAAHMRQSEHPMTVNIEKMVDFYKDLHNRLDMVASRAGVPMIFRSFP